MMIFIRTRRSTKLEYTTSLFDDEPIISFMLLTSCLQRCIKFIWLRYDARFLYFLALTWLRIVIVDDIKKS